MASALNPDRLDSLVAVAVCVTAPWRSAAALPHDARRPSLAQPRVTISRTPRAEPVGSPPVSHHLSGHLVFQEGIRERLLQAAVSISSSFRRFASDRNATQMRGTSGRARCITATW